VAIKLLPEMFTHDPDRLTRFKREARSASSLNHPNILTIHEIGETDSTHYIATEYIDGETLRAKLNRSKLSVTEALDIAVQCASALAAAHENGIIHRDIKPENIMLRRDSLVKVLDFGLAKLVEKKGVSVDALTEKHLKTAQGMVMGTVQYMSPEQTRGHVTDARTDTWSLGVVIYEMVAGQPPFTGETTADLIAEIVNTYPAPLSRSIDEVPERLAEIVSKSLEKNPDERYQTAKDLLIDLKRLKRKLDLEEEVERRQSPATKSGTAVFEREEKPRITVEDTAITDAGTRNTASSAAYIVSALQRHYLRTAAASVITLAIIGAVSYTVYRWLAGGVRSDALIVYASKIKLAAQALNSSNYSQAKQLLDETMPRPGEEDVRGFEWGYLANVLGEASASQPLSLSPGSGVDAVAFSPDGRTLATGGLDNVVRIWDLNTGNEVRSLAGHTKMVTFVAFSPDGRTLLTTGFDEVTRAWDVATGRTLFSLPETRGVASFSADGRSVVVPIGREIVFCDAVTGIEKGRFTSPVDPGAFLFSPDGTHFAVRGQDQTIHILNAADKRSVSTIKGHSDWVMDFAFSPDSNLLVTASKDRTAKLWDVRSGKELRTLNGHDDEIFEVEFSPDGTTIATGSNDDTTRLWDAAKGFENTRLRSHTGNVIALAYSPDGRKLASGGGDGAMRVWNASGIRQRGILRGHSEAVTRVMFSPSGRMLVSSSGDKTARVWDVEAERELITLGGHNDTVHTAIFSSDGARIVTVSEDKKI
jgi:WD40 repeat protein